MTAFILFFGLLFSPPQDGNGILVITEQEVRVSGFTSVGKFDCDFKRVGATDTLNINAPTRNSSIEFEIPITSFSCGNFLLNKDFRSTLKSKEYPIAEVKVKNVKEINQKLYCHLTVNLVGKVLEFPQMRLEREQDAIAGSLVLNFDMLELEPPKKFGGLIKVEDQLNLEFILGI